MGSSVSKINYTNIDSIVDKTNNNLKKPYEHTIKFRDGKIKKYKFSKTEEEDFQLKYKYMKLYELVKKIDYYNIENVKYKNIKDNEFSYLVTVLYLNGDITTLQLNQFQYDFFITTYKKLNNNPIPR